MSRLVRVSGLVLFMAVAFSVGVGLGAVVTAARDVKALKEAMLRLEPKMDAIGMIVAEQLLWIRKANEDLPKRTGGVPDWRS